MRAGAANFGPAGEESVTTPGGGLKRRSANPRSPAGNRCRGPKNTSARPRSPAKTSVPDSSQMGAAISFAAGFPDGAKAKIMTLSRRADVFICAPRVYGALKAEWH
jgi:hypothetical protein